MDKKYYNDFCKAALEEDGDLIEHITYQTKEQALIAVNSSPSSIRHINIVDEELALNAVNKNGNVIQFIENPSEAVREAAVTNSPHTLALIKRQTPRICLAALKAAKDRRLVPQIIKHIKSYVFDMTDL